MVEDAKNKGSLTLAETSKAVSTPDPRLEHLDKLLHVEERRIDLQEKEIENGRVYAEIERERIKSDFALENRRLDMVEKSINQDISTKNIWNYVLIFIVLFFVCATGYMLIIGNSEQRAFLVSILEKIILIGAGIGLKSLWDQSRKQKDFDE